MESIGEHCGVHRDRVDSQVVLTVEEGGGRGEFTCLTFTCLH